MRGLGRRSPRPLSPELLIQGRLLPGVNARTGAGIRELFMRFRIEKHRQTQRHGRENARQDVCVRN